MTIGSGLGGSVGVAAETTYGTFVAPTRFHDVTKSDLKKVKTTAQGGGLAASRFAQPGSRRLVTSRGATGTIDLEVPSVGFTTLLDQIFGGSSSAKQGATNAYLWTFDLADNFAKSFTVQQNVPNTAGAITPYSYVGCKVSDVEFQCSRDQLLTVTLTIDAQDVSETQTMATPSYLTGVMPFSFAQLGVKTGAYGSEAPIGGVNKVDVKFTRAMDTGRYYANGGGLKAAPIMNGWAAVSGSLDADFVDKTQLADLFRDDTSTSLVVEFIGPAIATGYNSTFRLKVPQIFLDTDSPTIDGPSIVTGTYNFTGTYDGTHPLITCEYLSLDTTV